MEDTKVQWHPGFVAAMNLDIVEYKSPEDHLDIDVFYKTMAYAALYKSYGKTLDAIRADDVTVTLIREAKPKGLIRYLKEHNYKLINQYKGIYYVMGNVLFPVQIVVTGELDLEEHIWISSLSQKMKKQDVQELFQRIQTLQSRLDRELADSVLQVSIEANRQMVEKWKGDDHMCQALLEIMEPEIRIIEKEREEAGWQKGMEKGIQQGMRQGIQGAIDMLRKLGYQEEKIKSSIMEGYQLSVEEAEEYF